MSHRLYYDDPYLTAFDATIESVDDRGDRVAVTLDRTAFYPTSGGQPCDIGTLGGLRVVDVFEREDGTIAHVIEASRRPGPVGPGHRVHGEIDWVRRFDHMQQHTGQHVLSAAFERLFRVRTISFHLGVDASTIDLSRDVSMAELAAAEDEANRVVWEDRPVAIRYATAEEAAAMNLRKESKREGTLRLIDVEHFDLSACGGTHVARTGAIGVIAVAGWERFKGGQRIEFLCGRRALGRFRTLRDAVAAATRLTSAGASELPATIERMQGEAKEQKRTVSALQTELARFRADALARAAEPIALSSGGDARLVARTIDADATALKSLAAAVTSQPAFVVALVSSAAPALVVIARSADLSSVNAQQLLASLLGKFGGRGGGRPELAQAGGLDGSPDTILAAVRAVL